MLHYQNNSMPNPKLNFQEIHDLFRPRILRYLTRLIGKDEAEDLTQEVFVKINKSLGTFRGDAQLSTWIYRIATNAAMDRFRSPSLALIGSEELSDNSFEADEDSRPHSSKSGLLDQQLIRKEMNDCIREVVDKLPENYRTVIVLSELEELTNSEIADVLQVTVDTVKIRLHRARARLKLELESCCMFYRDERNELACDRKVTLLNFLPR